LIYLFAGFAVIRGRSEMWNEDCREECDKQRHERSELISATLQQHHVEHQGSFSEALTELW